MVDSAWMRKIPPRLYLLILLSAFLQAIPFPIAGSVPLWRRLFCWICLVPFFAALLGRQRSGRPLSLIQAASLGYLCGIVWYLLNCYWIYPTMHIYGDLPEVASAGILLLFALYLGLYSALFGFLFCACRHLWGAAVTLLSAPLLWVAVELARDRITGFPWDLLGYTQVDSLLLTRLAPWTGVFGLSLVVACVNSLLALPLAGLRRAFSVTAMAAAAATAVLAGWTFLEARVPVANASGHSAVLLQENLSVGAGMQKAAETKEQMLRSFAALSHPTKDNQADGSNSDLIVWPESPASFLDSDDAYRRFMEDLAKSASAPVLADDLGLGPRVQDGSYSLYNSATLFRRDGSYGGRYDKIHLVPFGEYVPYRRLFFFTGHLLDGLPFIPGTQRTVFRDDGHTYGVFICYESIFGDEIRQFVGNGAQVLVNLSDDGWYGDSSAPWEHLDMVRMRAIENDRWVLRSTNTGVTAAINPRGQVTQSMPRHVRGSVIVNFEYLTGQTFYTRYGDWIAWICALLSAVMLLAGLLRSRTHAAAQ